jgi:hypothetical protein
MNIGPGELEELSFEVIGDYFHARARAGANQLQALADTSIFDAHQNG